MEWICAKGGVELGCRQRRNLVKHAQCFNARVAWMSVVLLGVATKNLLGERNWPRTKALALSAAFRNDCSGGLRNGCVAPRGEFGKQRCFADAGPT